MAKLNIVKGTTSKILRVFIQDSSSATGAGLTGVAFGDLNGHFTQEGDAAFTVITMATMTEGTWATGGFIEMDATALPGVYEIGIPDAALATGADSVFVMYKGATNMAPLVFEIQLTDRTDISPVLVNLGLVKQSAATQILVGPFISITTGLPLTALTLLNITAAVVKTAVPAGTPTRSGFALTASGGSNDFVSVGDGYWRLEITTSNTDTLGDIDFTFRDDDVFMPVHARGQVVPANVYDSWIGGSDKLQTDMTQIDGNDTDGNNATLFLKKLDINNSSGMAVEIDAAPSSSDGAVDIRTTTDGAHAVLIRNLSSGNGSQAVRIQNAASGGSPAANDAAVFIGSAGASTPAVSMTTAGGVAAAISVQNAGAFSDSTIPADILSVNGDTSVADNMETAGNGGSFDWGGGGTTVDVTKIGGDATSATRLKNASLGVPSFLVVAPGSGAPTTTEFDCDSTEATDDHFNGRRVVFISGVLDGQAATISNYTGSTKRLTVSTMTEAPSNNDRFIIIG